ncbi:MAG: sulfatase [Acidobacteriota bacterium]
MTGSERTRGRRTSVRAVSKRTRTVKRTAYLALIASLVPLVLLVGCGGGGDARASAQPPGSGHGARASVQPSGSGHGARGSSTQHRRIIHRFIEAVPNAWLPGAEAPSAASQQVFRWSLNDQDERKRWTATRATVQRAAGGARENTRPVAGLPLVEVEPPARLIRSLPPPLAADLHTLEVVLDLPASTTGGGLRLFWAENDRDFDGTRRLVAEAPLESLPVRAGWRRHRYRFALGEHPTWGNRPVTHLALNVGATGVARMALVEVRGLPKISSQLAIDPVAILEDPARLAPHRLTLAGEMRSVLAAPPGRVLEHTFARAPRGLRLRFGYGVAGRPAGSEDARALVFRVRASTGADGEGFTRDWRYRLRPEMGAGWFDADVALAEWADRPLTVRLTVEADGPIDAIPVWANPELLAEADGPPPPHVLLVSIDTLRADHLSAYGHSRLTSPMLDAWGVRHAVRFTNVIAPTPWTHPSHISLLTGLDPFDHGVNHGAVPPTSLVTLASQLRNAGYRTEAITGGGYLHPRFGLDGGFDRYRYWIQRERADAEMADGVARAMQLLEHYRDEPVFLFLHTYEVHSPYHDRRWPRGPLGTEPSLPADTLLDLSPRSRKRSEAWRQGARLVRRKVDPAQRVASPPDVTLQGVRGELRLRYDSAISWMDHQLGKLLGSIERDGRTRRTLIAITADHGEALLERAPYDIGDGWNIGHNAPVPPVLHVPLWFAAPPSMLAETAVPTGRRVETLVRLIDIAPTILDLLGVPSSSTSPRAGRSLRPLLERADGVDDGPRDAWSYAASSNYGLVVQRGMRLRYRYDDTPWTHDERTSRDLLIDPSRDIVLPADHAAQPAMRREVERVLTEVLPGVVLRLRNPCNRRLATILRTRAFDRSRLKMIRASTRADDMPEIEVTGSSERRKTVVARTGQDRVAVRMAPGDDVYLHLAADAVGDQIEIYRRPPGIGASDAQIAFADLPVRIPYSRDADMIEVPIGRCRGAETPTLQAWRRGAALASDSMMDDETAEALRALGYIN